MFDQDFFNGLLTVAKDDADTSQLNGSLSDAMFWDERSERLLSDLYRAMSSKFCVLCQRSGELVLLKQYEIIWHHAMTEVANPSEFQCRAERVLGGKA